MSLKHTIAIEAGWALPAVWSSVALQTKQWLQLHGLHERDAVVLMPFAALLPPLREAFAQAGGWQLRVETTLTLGASLAPPAQHQPGACGGDAVLDRLQAALLLRSPTAGSRLAQDDAQVFDHMVTALVEATQSLMAAAAAVAPQQRDAFWLQARAAVAQAMAGPFSGAWESRLLGLALEWAALSCNGPAMHSDRLHSLKPSAWVVVRLGGPDAVADAVAQASAAPALWLNLDPALTWELQDNQAPLAGLTTPTVERWFCDDFEDEAQAVAELAIDAVNAGRVPVALVAVDRALVRRVRALLDRQQVPVLDETGWLLATTPAGAQLMALLHAALALHRAGVSPGLQAQDCPHACRDAVLDALKCSSAVAAGNPALAIDALEALWRGRRRSGDRAAAQRCWHGVLSHLAPLLQAAQGPPRPLQHWLLMTRQVLQADGSLQQLEADAAGRQVLLALRLQAELPAAWEQAARNTVLTLAAFVAWAAATLELSPYLPLPDDQAVVVLTPLARAFGRPFGQLLVPGADHQQLGSPATAAALMSPALARALGLPDARAKHLLQRLALVHLMRGGAVAFTRRLRDAGQPLSESPDVAWLLQPSAGAAAEAATAADWQAWRPGTRLVQPQAVSRPLPSAANDLPQRLSASQLDTYRQCPYRFFARAVLRLDEPEELDATLAKRDYGNWLHEVLHRFHSERDYRAPAAPQLQAAALWATTKLALDEAELLPWQASFESFCPAYLKWMADRELQGWYWADGETDHERAGDEWAGTRLWGRLDRLDHGPEGQRQVIDYKTGDASALLRKVKQPLEDTQLAFYAALLSPQGESGGAVDDDSLQACYLALDDPKAPRVIEHPQVALSAAVMVHAVAAEWQRLRQGEALQALGEGAVCETCEARGLCRRDHWAPAAPRANTGLRSTKDHQ